MNTKMLSLYVTNLLCEDESEHEGVWPFQGEGIANDAIRLSALITIKQGGREPVQTQTPTISLGDNYQDGTNVTMNQKIFSLPLASAADYPIAVNAVLVLGEEDLGGNFDGNVRSTITAVAQQAKSSVTTAVTSAAGGAIGTAFGPFGTLIGAGIGAAAGELIALIGQGINSLESDVWPPEDIALVVTADAQPIVHTGQVQFRDKPNFRNLGGQYRLTYEWRLEESAVANYGSVIKLKHQLTGHALHSHTAVYGHAGSSGQQQVTAFAGADDNDLWRVMGRNGQPNDAHQGQPVQQGAVIRLEHLLTGRNLHSHYGFPSPVSGQQEVTCFGENGVGDDNDNWRIEIEGGGTWAMGKRVRLIHVLTNHALHSHAGFAHPEWTLGQQEVTGFASRDDNDWWLLTEISTGKSDEVVKSLQVEIRMGREGTDVVPEFLGYSPRRDPSDAVGFVRLSDGRVIEKNFSNDAQWAPFSTHVGQLDLPPGVRLGMIEAFGIRSITAGPDHAADNWMIDGVTVTYIGERASGLLLTRSGNPLWYFQKNANLIWETPVHL